jgi:archaellum biogenesis ATPase FlaH
MKGDNLADITKDKKSSDNEIASKNKSQNKELKNKESKSTRNSKTSSKPLISESLTKGILGSYDPPKPQISESLTKGILGSYDPSKPIISMSFTKGIWGNYNPSKPLICESLTKGILGNYNPTKPQISESLTKGLLSNYNPTKTLISESLTKGILGNYNQTKPLIGKSLTKGILGNYNQTKPLISENLIKGILGNYNQTKPLIGESLTKGVLGNYNPTKPLINESLTKGILGNYNLMKPLISESLTMGILGDYDPLKLNYFLDIKTKLSNTLPFNSSKLFLDKSIALDDTISGSFFISNTEEIMNNFLKIKEVSSNLFLHNASNILELDYSKFIIENPSIISLSKDLEKYNSTTFLLDSSFLDNDNKESFRKYVSSTVDYIYTPLVSEFLDDENQTISLSTSGSEILNTKTNESMIIEDISLVDDVIGLINVSKNDLTAFYRFIQKFPMLAMNDEAGIGHKIYELIKTNFYSNLVIEQDIVLYRARKYDTENTFPYTEDQVYRAPYGSTRRGRFNSPEMNHLYMSTDLVVTLCELDAKVNDRFAILQCIPKHEVRLFDLTRGNYELQSFCMEATMDTNKREYLIPNFVSNCCRNVGYEGIKYKSVKDVTQINYVLFEHDMGHFHTLEFYDCIIEDISDNFRYSKL